MNYLLYLLIIVVKTVEVSISTLRIKLITKGEKVKGSLVGFVEIILWLVVVSTVLTNITEDPMKVLAYAIGFSLGNYFGLSLENKLGVGTMRVEVITKDEDGWKLANHIRSLGYAVTIVNGKGMNYERAVLIIIVQRKMAPVLVSRIKEFETNAFITITDTEPIYGGFGSLKK